MSEAPHGPLGPVAPAASLRIDFATLGILIQRRSISFFGGGFLGYLADTSDRSYAEI